MKGKAEAKAVLSFSAGAIVCVINGQPKVLLLTQSNSFYKRRSKARVLDIGPKGRIEDGEDAVAAAEREIKEEIGVKPLMDTNFRAVKDYEFLDRDQKGNSIRVRKSVVYFLALLRSGEAGNIRISPEHSKFEVVTFKEAIRKAKHQSDRDILSQCEEYVRGNLGRMVL